MIMRSGDRGLRGVAAAGPEGRGRAEGEDALGSIQGPRAMSVLLVYLRDVLLYA